MSRFRSISRSGMNDFEGTRCGECLFFSANERSDDGALSFEFCDSILILNANAG